jgi:hypothetical protein
MKYEKEIMRLVCSFYLSRFGKYKGREKINFA